LTLSFGNSFLACEGGSWTFFIGSTINPLDNNYGVLPLGEQW